MEITKPILLSLLRDDLINTKLVLTLNEAGLNADLYMLNLSSTIFMLMGFGQGFDTEDIYDGYRELARLVLYADIAEVPETLDKMAEEIYRYLEGRK